MIFCPLSGNWCGEAVINDLNELRCDCIHMSQESKEQQDTKTS